MDSSSNISTHQTLEGAMPEHMGDGRVSASVLEGKDRARTRLVDAETQTEANFFASTEVVRLISNSREELERRVRELERELNRIKQERDEAIVEAFDARRRSPVPEDHEVILSIHPPSSTEPLAIPPSSAISSFRSLPSAAFNSVLSIFPSLKRRIAPLPSPRTTSTVPLLSRIRSPSPPPPSTPSNPPGPTISLLHSPSDARPAPPDLLSQLSILWLGNLDTGITPFLILYFFRLPRSELFPRPLAISKTHSGNIIVGLRSDQDVDRIRGILSKDPVFPGFTKKFQVKKNSRGSYQFKWNHLSNEVRESWTSDQTLPEQELVDPDENEERYAAEKESILKSKRSSREPSLAQRISSGGNRKERRNPLQKQPTPSPSSPLPAIPVNFAASSVPSTSPAINFAAPPVPAFMLAPFPSSSTPFPASPLPASSSSSSSILNPFSRPGYGGSSSTIPQRRSLPDETEEQKEKKPRVQ